METTEEGKVLHLTLKKKWFDMIMSGEKTHEYREYKPYWEKRLIIAGTHPPICKDFDFVKLTNGYGDKPTGTFKCKGISLNFGNAKWGGDEKNIQFVIRLGEKI